MLNKWSDTLVKITMTNLSKLNDYKGHHLSVENIAGCPHQTGISKKHVFTKRTKYYNSVGIKMITFMW